jgi:hypothetical protein
MSVSKDRGDQLAEVFCADFSSMFFFEEGNRDLEHFMASL